nr:hypothetical protein [Tanacetum cinerariifolium]
QQSPRPRGRDRADNEPRGENESSPQPKVTIRILLEHLTKYGWDPSYKTWTSHGESNLPPPVIDNTRQPHMSDMRTYLNDLSYIPPNNKQNEPTQGDIGETSNEPTQAKRNEFEELYASSNEELYLGCDYVTRLDFMANFTYFKVKGKLTDSISNEMLKFFQHVFPTSKGYKLPPSYYTIKKTFKMIELGYKSIHACVNNCFLFRGEYNKDVHFCPVCNTSRWKDSNTPGKKVPKKVLCYLSIIPRLQRLYKSSHTAKEMTWHATGKCMEPDKMQHRLMVEHGRILSPKSSFMLTLLIHGPKSSGKDINVYLRPLIDDIKDLWALKGVETIDIATGHKFNMRAMVLWTINDFFARCSLSGWSGQGYKACPTCNEDTPSMRVLGKIAYDVTMKFNRLDHNVDCPSQRVSFRCSDHPEIDLYRAKFKSEFPNQDMKEEFPRHIDKDPSVSARSELFTLACGPTPTLISVNSCVLNGVRFVVHNRDERRITQNSSICSPGDKDREMYYGQLEEFLKFSYMSFKVVLFRAKWFDTSNEGHALPHDLANSDDEDLVNVDDDDVAVMSADVARGYDGDGGGDDRPPPHQICGGCRGHPKTQPGRQESRKAEYPQGNQEPWIKDDHGSIWPAGDPIVREFPMHFRSWHNIPEERKAGVIGKIEFDLTPHMQSNLWPKIKKGIEQDLAKIYTDNMSSLKAEHWVANPDDGTYNMLYMSPSVSPGKIAGEQIPFELFPACFPRRHVAGKKYSHRHVAGDRGILSLRIEVNVVVI